MNIFCGLSLNERKKDKVKLGCILSALSPDWSLERLTTKLKQIDWSEVDEFNDLYKMILE
ncbi:hypothetical protein [Thermosipho atlanticus]|uniref:hypothetical protein n=1 Tax=Thermosipho atlanticus TaxID=238991 RepID=UPI0009340964|nr:hypothetical protein [Thermosipho atlanticus]